MSTTALTRRRPQAARTRVTRRAKNWREASARVLVGGVNSPVRTFRKVGQPPICVRQAAGPIVRDVEGRRFVDLIMGWGALILGHRHPAVVRAAASQLSRGVVFGLTSEPEITLATLITEAFPSIEQVRFTASGTEACMTAIRLARAATGRTKVLTFEGCYHGHSDGMLVKRRASGLATLGMAGSAGVPESIAQETVVAPYNDIAALEAAIAEHGEALACAILEPIAANMGVVVPEGAYLRRVRELASRHGILLIFDEVVTGFRVAFGGAQARFGVSADLTVLGKIIGGGLPIGAVGGPRRLMRRLAPDGDVYHAGTFAGHPLAMAAGAATIRHLQQRPPYATLDALGGRLAEAITSAARRAKISVQVNRAGSMLTAFFSDQPVTGWSSVEASSTNRFAQWSARLREAGVLVPPSAFEAMFLSTAHTSSFIKRVADATEQLRAPNEMPTRPRRA